MAASALDVNGKKLDWGDTVRVLSLSSGRHGLTGSINGFRRTATSPRPNGEPVIEVLVLVEFSDGEAVEMLSTNLELVK
jgi:hypothetical protein